MTMQMLKLATLHLARVQEKMLQRINFKRLKTTFANFNCLVHYFRVHFTH